MKPRRAEKGGHPQQGPSSRCLSAHGPGRGASPRHLARRSLGAGAAGAARSHGQARQQDTSGAVSGKARFPRGQPSAAGPAPRGERKGFPRGALSAEPPPPGPARAVSSHRHTHRGRCRSRPHRTSGFQEGGGAPKPLSQPLPRGRCRWRRHRDARRGRARRRRGTLLALFPGNPAPLRPGASAAALAEGAAPRGGGRSLPRLPLRGARSPHGGRRRGGRRAGAPPCGREGGAGGRLVGEGVSGRSRAASPSRRHPRDGPDRTRRREAAPRALRRAPRRPGRRRWMRGGGSSSSAARSRGVRWRA